MRKGPFQPAYNVCNWPTELRPLEETGGSTQEAFSCWWQRCGRAELGHLPEAFVEQWIFRHWDYTVHRYFDLKQIQTTITFWKPDFILQNVASATDEVFEPESDMSRWTDQQGVPNKEPLLSLCSVSRIWNYPPIVFETPEGFINHSHKLEKKQYLLIEGHTRRLALNALVYRDIDLPPQPIFIMHFH